MDQTRPYSSPFLLPGLSGQYQPVSQVWIGLLPNCLARVPPGLLCPPTPQPRLSYYCLGGGMFDPLRLWAPPD